jgi:hypothetical protein
LSATTLTLALPLSVNAQTKIKKTDVPTKSITTQTATTEDGRKVLLSSDGTWNYSRNDINVPNAAVKDKNTLKLETGIVMRSGDVKPISRTTFYLLNKSFTSIIMDAGLSEYYGKDKTTESLCRLFSAYYKDFGERKRANDAVSFTMSAVKPHVIQTVTSDFGGKATFINLPLGKYWLVGFSGVGKSYFTWDLEASLLSGDNSIILDQNNICGSWDL